jgi:hypothetical protein
MTQLNVLDATRGERGGYKVDVSRGERVGRVSSMVFPTGGRAVPISVRAAHLGARPRRAEPNPDSQNLGDQGGGQP